MKYLARFLFGLWLATAMIAIDILEWPGFNQAFIVSFVATVVLSLAIIPYGKRRPVGHLKLFEDPRQVCFDGPFRDAAPVGNPLVAEPLCNV